MSPIHYRYDNNVIIWKTIRERCCRFLFINNKKKKMIFKFNRYYFFYTRKRHVPIHKTQLVMTYDYNNILPSYIILTLNVIYRMIWTYIFLISYVYKLYTLYLSVNHSVYKLYMYIIIYLPTKEVLMDVQKSYSKFRIL